MKLRKSEIIYATVLATLIGTNARVFAANTALSNGDLVTPPADVTISGVCSDLKQCKPGDVINVSAPEEVVQEECDRSY